MAIVDFLAVLAVLSAVVWLVSGPLRSPAQAAAREGAQLADLEAAKESKYREIRDAELDFRTGKLSEAEKAMAKTLGLTEEAFLAARAA